AGEHCAASPPAPAESAPTSKQRSSSPTSNNSSYALLAEITSLDGNLDAKTQMLRAAELWLWSATGSSMNDPDKAVAEIKAAGLTVVLARKGRGKPVLNADRSAASVAARRSWSCAGYAARLPGWRAGPRLAAP
ncbi:hypothetical protein, partial [Pseudonocardia nigra]|uniref:hypothetical protein n=1 Tax=Pseudonocardia nigra TaxID=1921578 RepID=UPI001C5EB102